jgi:hypothetical protein
MQIYERYGCKKCQNRSRNYSLYLRAREFSKLDLSEYDLVISSSGAEAKAVKTGSKTVHIAYCHAPTHYYWSRYNEYMENPGFGVFESLSPIKSSDISWKHA